MTSKMTKRKSAVFLHFSTFSLCLSAYATTITNEHLDMLSAMFMTYVSLLAMITKERKSFCEFSFRLNVASTAGIKTRAEKLFSHLFAIDLQSLKFTDIFPVISLPPRNKKRFSRKKKNDSERVR